MSEASADLEVVLVLSDGKTQGWRGVRWHRAVSERVHAFEWEGQVVTLYVGVDATVSVIGRA